MIMIPDQLKAVNSLERNFDVRFYPGQLLPLAPRYHEGDRSWHTMPYDLPVTDRIGLLEGDRLYLEASNPDAANPWCPSSYKVVVVSEWDGDVTVKTHPLQHFIPGSGNLCLNVLDYLKALDAVLKQEMETPLLYEQRMIHLVASRIPADNFYIIRPKRNRGFEDLAQVLYYNGRWLRLRGKHWRTKQEMVELKWITEEQNVDEYHYNVWGEYASEKELATYMFKNAMCISPRLLESSSEMSRAWHTEVEFLRHAMSLKYYNKMDHTEIILSAERATRFYSELDFKFRADLEKSLLENYRNAVNYLVQLAVHLDQVWPVEGEYYSSGQDQRVRVKALEYLKAGTIFNPADYKSGDEIFIDHHCMVTGFHSSLFGTTVFGISIVLP